MDPVSDAVGSRWNLQHVGRDQISAMISSERQFGVQKSPCFTSRSQQGILSGGVATGNSFNICATVRVQDR